VDFQGCGFDAKQCTLNISSGDCSTVSCDVVTGDCVTQDQVCAINTAVVIGATLAAGAIAGIVAGVIIFVLACGGASVAVYSKLADGEVVSISNNPLYESQSYGGANPLHETDGEVVNNE